MARPLHLAGAGALELTPPFLAQDLLGAGLEEVPQHRVVLVERLGLRLAQQHEIIRAVQLGEDPLGIRDARERRGDPRGHLRHERRVQQKLLGAGV
jgi:hypothetical protein